MDHIGGKTKQALFLNEEAHKLHVAFTVATEVKAGQPVKLNTDGEIVPLGNADGKHLLIGHAIKDGKVDEEISVIMCGHARITAAASINNLDPGPVKWASFDGTTGMHRYTTAADIDTAQGHALQGSDAIGDIIEVVLF